MELYLKHYKYTGIFLAGLWLSLLLGLFSCANIVPPAGGDKDLTPPKLLSLSPQDSVRNQKVKKIVLHFNKFVELNDLPKNLDMSPQLDITPTVIANGKRIEIRIVDSLLKPNTTYRISLGNAITDNRERTPYGNFQYTFTTGDYFDSLQVKGNVIDVFAARPDTGAIIVLYPEPFKDSMLLSKKPMYVSRVDGRGRFHLEGLPDKAFHIFAIADADNNKMYNVNEERIGFLEGTIQPKPASDSGSISLYTFKALPAVTAGVDTPVKIKPGMIGRVIATEKNAQKYIVQADSSNLDKETFELNKPLPILLNTIVGKIDSAKIYLSYINKGGIETEARRTIATDSARILVQHTWEPETIYTLRLIKGWATDTAGKELPPAKVSFRTKRREDYALMHIHIPQQYRSGNYVLSVYKDQDSILQQAIRDSVITLSLLNPGKYTLRIIEDLNQNGKWDPGNLWMKRQAEMIYPHYSVIDLKAGWENDIDFKYDPAILLIPERKSNASGKPVMDK